MFPITKGQKLALILLPKKLGISSRDERLFLVSQLLGREIDTFNDLSLGDWQRVRNKAYPRWWENDWELSDPLKQQVAGILRVYREQVLGQMPLFSQGKQADRGRDGGKGKDELAN